MHLRKPIKIIIIIVVALIIFRMFLPSIVLHYSNKALANLSGYYGHVEDIDISLYRGAYQVNTMYLNKVESATKKQTKFLTIDNMDLAVQWKALFQGKLVGKVSINDPELFFTKNKTELGDVKNDTADFRKVLKHFMPLDVNRLQIDNGKVHYIDNTSTPPVDVFLTNMDILAENLQNASKEKILLPSPVTAHATAYDGTLALNMKINILAENSTFDLNAEIKNVALPKLNAFLKAYGNFDVNKGTLGLYTEFAAKNGRYIGYVKPVIKDLKVLGPQDKNDGFLQKIYEGLIGVAGKILENHKKDQIASKVPIEGEFGKSHTNIAEAIWELLKNAFIQALIPSIDNQINITSVDKVAPAHTSLLQKIFSGGKGKDDKRKNKK